MGKKFTSFRQVYVSFALLIVLSLSFGCSSKENEADSVSELVNGSFEEPHDTGKWVGWTRSDAAFNVRGVIDVDTTGGVTMEKDGNFFFSGAAAGNETMRGTLTSDVFTLTGNGFISFKMGAGKNNEKVYVEFFEENGAEPIAHVVNSDCDGTFISDHLITKVVDLSNYLGKRIYIKVTDNDDGTDLSYVNLDAFKICTTDEEVEKCKAEYADQIAKYGAKPFEENTASNDIVNGSFETGDLTGWLILEGTAFKRTSVAPSTQMYWTDRSVYADGNYYIDGNNNGEIPESATGSMRSTKFTLGGDGYISFMIGAGTGDCYVALCDGTTDEELIKVRNEYFSDPTLALTLLRVYMDASDHIGKVVYLKVVDANDTSGFAFMNVDDFRVSLTKSQVEDLEAETLAKAKAETYTSASYDDITSLVNFYSTYPYPFAMKTLIQTRYAANAVVSCGTTDLTKLISNASAKYGDETYTNFEVKGVAFGEETINGNFSSLNLDKPGFYTVTYGLDLKELGSIESTFTVEAMADDKNVANGGFEAGNLTGWTVLNDDWLMIEGKPAGVISAATYWGEQLPYNQAGNYHLDGWNTGIDEGKTWRIRSTVFTLSGSGFISVRMGGHAAAVRVFKEDGTQIGFYPSNRFSDVNFPSLAAGGSWADMGTYVMDLSKYIGSKLYIELCDEDVAGWAQAFFDEVVTCYETAPDCSALYDTVNDGGTGDPVNIPWQLIENYE
ncbi:MAG: hypothetical protein K6B75_02325 [Lachnospiraceae bacterium]|nr:hypothetical protein [Lachnospiraceae bacterium]